MLQNMTNTVTTSGSKRSPNPSKIIKIASKSLASAILGHLGLTFPSLLRLGSIFALFLSILAPFFTILAPFLVEFGWPRPCKNKKFASLPPRGTTPKKSLWNQSIICIPLWTQGAPPALYPPILSISHIKKNSSILSRGATPGKSFWNQSIYKYI